MYTFLAKLIVCLMLIFSPAVAYADAVDDYKVEFDANVRAFTQNSARHSGYSFNNVFWRVRSAFNVLFRSAQTLDSELSKTQKPKRRGNGYTLMPDGSGSVKVSQ